MLLALRLFPPLATGAIVAVVIFERILVMMKGLDTNPVLLVDSLPDGQFDWLTVWEGECNILCSEESEEGSYEFYEKGESSLSLKREEDQDGSVSICISIPNNALIPEEVGVAIRDRLGVDLDLASWGSDGDEGQYGSYYI